MLVTCSTQLIAVKGAAHYVVNHSDKTRQKDRKNLPQVVVPGLESERKDRGELTRWEGGGKGRGGVFIDCCSDHPTPLVLTC